jgi:hypothetical protein
MSGPTPIPVAKTLQLAAQGDGFSHFLRVIDVDGVPHTELVVVDAGRAPRPFLFEGVWRHRGHYWSVFKDAGMVVTYELDSTSTCGLFDVPVPIRDGTILVETILRVPPRAFDFEPVDGTEPVAVRVEPKQPEVEETLPRAPLRGEPEPTLEPKPTLKPEPVPVEPVSVSWEVERNARALADAVRGRGRTYRELFHGRVPASYEPDVDYAVRQGWVVTDGDVVSLGPVDSRLPEEVGDVSLSSSRGWSPLRLFG